MTWYMWHVTSDTSHLTCDNWKRTCWGRWTLSQNVRSLALTIWKWWFVENIFTKDVGLNQLMNHKGVCRTAPATPGLLKRLNYYLKIHYYLEHFSPFFDWIFSMKKKKSLASFALKPKQTDNGNKHIFFIFNM